MDIHMYGSSPCQMQTSNEFREALTQCQAVVDDDDDDNSKIEAKGKRRKEPIADELPGTRSEVFHGKASFLSSFPSSSFSQERDSERTALAESPRS